MLTLKQLKEEPLVRGSFIAIIGTVLIGFLNYIFQLLMSRLLSPAEFGSLAALLSLSIILTVPNQAIGLTATKHISVMQANNNLKSLPLYAQTTTKRILPYGIFLFIIILGFSSLIKNFLNLSEIWPLYILAACFIFSFLSPLGIGIYRGIQNFYQASLSQFLSTLVRLIMGLIFVAIGWGVSGAILSYLLSAIFLIFYFIVNLKLYKKSGEEKKQTEKTTRISHQAKATLIVSFCLICLYNLDIILVKHFLSAIEAGNYAIISLAGKIIIFFTASINNVMFPLASNNHEIKKSNKRIIILSLIFIVGASIGIILLYSLFPELIISILFGAKYLGIASLLWLGGIIFALYSIINFLSLYFLSVQKTKFSVILAIGTVMEVVLIYFFHYSLFSILYSILSVMIFMSLALAIYYFISSKNDPIKYEENLDSHPNL
ncbi:MAG: Capsular polysaccharide biosynthesis protein [Parcubacteria group bacterium GW2011_GWA2_40_23]|nr:MAG: Capsular polysaccharide biosynthesis protein [Parcubacteria group bacterium GW2011_GWA2_40_23]